MDILATSHGKSRPCDGVGGTVKRTTTRASLQRPVNNQIMDVHAMFKFCANLESRYDKCFYF